MKTKNIKFIILSALTVLLFSNCQKTETIGQTQTGKFANEWWANLYIDGQAYYSTPSKIVTYNISANNDSIWVDDSQNLYGFMVKAGTNASSSNSQSLLFSTKDAANNYYDPSSPVPFPATVTITDGQVLPKAGHSKTGLVTDSIYFKVVFSDDPTTTYEIKGTATTNRTEDDY